MNKMLQNKKILAGIISIVIFFVAIIVGRNLFTSQDPGSDVYITIQQGDSVDSVITRLNDAGISASAKSLYKAFNDQDGKIYANVYALKSNMSAQEIVSILNSPTSNYQGKSITIIEGDNLESIANKIAKASDNKFSAEDIMNYWDNENTVNSAIEKHWFLTDEIKNPQIFHPFEGYFAPATYPLVPTASIEELTESFFSSMSNNLMPYKDPSARKDLTIHQFVSLGSVVEREALHPQDYAKIAGVFFNRLNINMPLQSDITVLYAQGVHKEKVLYKDLEFDSPYNTYKYPGIQVGPISTVRKEVLKAVSQPEQSDYLYFFAKQHTGEVIYSKTLEEHEKVSRENAWE